MPVVVLGSINLDISVLAPRLPGSGETVLGGDLTRALGGKGANQAAAAAATGVPTTLIAAVGQDADGDNALNALVRAGVETRWVSVSDHGATGVALIVIDESGDNQIAVAPGANGNLDSASVRAALTSIARDHGGQIVLLVSFEISAAAIDTACQFAATHRWPLVINPAPFQPLRSTMSGATTILTPNAIEARALTGLTFDQYWDRHDMPEAVSALLDRGIRAFVITLGRQGALLYQRNRVSRHPAPQVAAVDTTGAGDAFNGAFAAALARGEQLEAAADAGVHAGSMATTVRGTHPPSEQAHQRPCREGEQ